MKKYLEIAKRLRILRGKKTQTNFSKEIGAKLRTYQNYEAGERVPHIHILTRTAELCGTTTDWILTGDLNIEKARIVERAKAAIYLEEIAEKIEGVIEREERLLYTGVKEEAPTYVIDESRFEEKQFIHILRGWIEEKKQDERIKYWMLPDSTKKLIDNVIEILESGNEVIIDPLKANIKIFLEAVRTQKKTDEDKGGVKNEA